MERKLKAREITMKIFISTPAFTDVYPPELSQMIKDIAWRQNVEPRFIFGSSLFNISAKID